MSRSARADDLELFLANAFAGYGAAAAMRALAGKLVRVRDSCRPKGRAGHTKRCSESLSQAMDFGRLGHEF